MPIHAFDVIIADECHRGYPAQEMSIWRETINHFDAIKIGLTATPAAHTTAVFGPPVFRYTVEQAILEGYLVDYEPVAIKSEDGQIEIPDAAWWRVFEARLASLVDPGLGLQISKYSGVTTLELIRRDFEPVAAMDMENGVAASCD